ncbi:hypothetical protein C9413_07400 [Rhizobium sp. SEMIA 4085]|uniref:hypothetical protein n=1 Tax=Rhizobium TaxID=379 RepID=UPI001478B54C|nr:MULTISPECIES: hypothetical protein [Rhizobium]NNH29335.1 hypothetical protein [Rhizobium sp. SEMIA 4085]
MAEEGVVEAKAFIDLFMIALDTRGWDPFQLHAIGWWQCHLASERACTCVFKFRHDRDAATTSPARSGRSEGVRSTPALDHLNETGIYRFGIHRHHRLL